MGAFTLVESDTRVHFEALVTDLFSGMKGVRPGLLYCRVSKFDYGYTLPSNGQTLSLTVGDNLPASSLSPELNKRDNVKGKGGNQLKWKYLRCKFVL